VRAAIEMNDSPDKPLMRSLGEFFGHVVKGIRTDPAAGRERNEVRRTVEEEKRPDGVILRRTTIEEVELPPGTAPPHATPDVKPNARPDANA
jgi:hypothetical protein